MIMGIERGGGEEKYDTKGLSRVKGRTQIHGMSS
jgi:hypothetical protein